MTDAPIATPAVPAADEAVLEAGVDSREVADRVAAEGSLADARVSIFDLLGKLDEAEAALVMLAIRGDAMVDAVEFGVDADYIAARNEWETSRVTVRVERDTWRPILLPAVHFLRQYALSLERRGMSSAGMVSELADTLWSALYPPADVSDGDSTDSEDGATLGESGGEVNGVGIEEMDDELYAYVTILFELRAAGVRNLDHGIRVQDLAKRLTALSLASRGRSDAQGLDIRHSDYPTF